MRNYLLLLFSWIFTFAVFGQDVVYEVKKFQGEKVRVFHPKKVKEHFDPVLINLEVPAPGGKSTRSHLQELKKEVSRRYPVKKLKSGNGRGERSGAIVNPQQGRNFGTFNYVYLPTDTVIQTITAGIPNDNTLAISNGGMLLAAFNSRMYGYDIVGDSVIFNNNSSVITLGEMASADSVPTSSPFDPKLIYDPDEDRFIIVFLSGRTPGDSEIIVGFSTSNNPADAWNVYALSGNPLNDNTWADYPAIALTKDELYITINQLYPDSSWQTGFKQSLIWQVDKSDGYNGSSAIDADAWFDIKFGGKSIRNLNPVTGGDEPYGPNAYFLSNRNFSFQNDSIFLLEITDNLDGYPLLNIDLGLTDVPYGLPPNARQKDGHFFDTNDSRVLGAYLENNQIQYVSNCVDPGSGFSAVYHGFIDNVDDSPSFRGRIIVNDSMDIGYPNLSLISDSGGCNQSIIAFDHSSPDDFAGHSAIYYDQLEDDYSDFLILKEGLNYVDRHGNDTTGLYERWGDYSGIQRKYNEKGVVWASGYYGTSAKSNSIWTSEIITDQPEKMVLKDMLASACFTLENCEGSIEVKVENGNPPYSYLWSDGQKSAKAEGLCNGEYSVTVFDACNDTVIGRLNLGGSGSSSISISEVISTNCSFKGSCDGSLVAVSNVDSLLSYKWSDGQTTPKAINLCEGDYSVTITDACMNTATAKKRIESGPVPDNSLFPNPATVHVNLYFALEVEGEIEVGVYNLTGQRVATVYRGNAEIGSNLLTFSTVPLARGSYVARVIAGENTVLTEKFIKQ